MNSNIVSTGPFLAAAVAFVVLPVSPIASGFIVTVIGILSVLVHDYRGPRGAVSPPARVVSFEPAGPRQAELREAA